MNNCHICGKLMWDAESGMNLQQVAAAGLADLTSLNCGGDCAQCMADAGDPDCQVLLGQHHEDQP